MAATGIGRVGQIVIGATLGAAESAMNQKISDGSINTDTLIGDTISGAIGGFFGGKGASNGSKFMNYHRNEFMKNLRVSGVDNALAKLAKHTWNWSKRNLAQSTFMGVTKAFVANKTSTLVRAMAK